MAEAMKIVEENPDGLTLQEIADIMGVTRERVRQIQNDAFDKMRRMYEESVEGLPNAGSYSFEDFVWAHLVKTSWR